MEGKLVRRFGNRRSKIQVNKRIFINIKKFERGNKELVKVAKLRKIEQKERKIEEFVQKFQKIGRNSKYKKKILVKEFKRRINRMIRRKLMEVKRPLTSIEQQYNYRPKKKNRI